MISQKIIILSVSVVLVAGTLGFDWMESLFPPADAHGVGAQLQSRFIKIEDETFNRQSLQTGETLTINGQLISLVERDLQAWVTIFSESTNEGNKWEIIARDPQGSVLDIEGNPRLEMWRDPPDNVFDIEGNTAVPYSISAIALEAGVYHVHTQLNVASVGPGLGPGQTVVVEGDPIIKPMRYMDIVYQSIIIGANIVMFAAGPWQVIGWALGLF